MTRRKPPDTSMESWVEGQIVEAANRGDFDNLPGAGKPLPNLHDPNAWLTAYLKREGVETEALLPEPLRLRKEIERLPDVVRGAPTERLVRELVTDLNDRIKLWMRNGQDTHFIVPLVDEEDVVAAWRQARPAEPAAAQPTASRRRWWHRGTSRTP